ncbi:hypothetical protein ACFYOV_09195 [Streptomyces sp. NPDC005931]|uniref:hypothetical protein n=1 Tax=Streptomyces sp. NPDC005931 TaxID=3364737 RepID=UPI0036A6A1AD
MRTAAAHEPTWQGGAEHPRAGPPGHIAGRSGALRTAGPSHQPARAADHDPAGTLPVPDRLLGERCADHRDGCGACLDTRRPPGRVPARGVLAARDPAGRLGGACSRSGEPGWSAGAAVPMHRA